MRCPDCNKFVSMEPGDPEAELHLDDGQVIGTVRIVMNCAECNTELKESNFDIELDVPEEILKAHSGEGHELDLDESDFENIDKSEGKGRYRKTYYGAHGDISLCCSCRPGDQIVNLEFNDYVQASNMDEC